MLKPFSIRLFQEQRASKSHLYLLLTLAGFAACYMKKINQQVLKITFVAISSDMAGQARILVDIMKSDSVSQQ